VETPEAFCLRICEPGADEAQVKAEIEWLDALKRDTPLNVPRPVPALDGKSLSQIDGRYCVLFRWIEGEPVSRTMSAEMASVAGQILAILHRHVRAFRPTARVSRRYDVEWLVGPRSWWTIAAASHLEAAHEELTPTVERCARLMRNLGETPEHFGLINADLHFGNLLRTREGYAVIDFESLGWGYFFFDMAYVEGELADYNDPPLIDAFIEAYATSRKVPVDRSALRLFSIAAGVVFLEWVFSSPNPEVRAQKLRWVPVTLERMRMVGRQVAS
jgi:Ser/Thr protein kinase RdoA (MazF antagonist)